MENKKKKAIALQYEQDDFAPKVIATGQGYVAETIAEVAKKEKIPIHKDSKLAESLSVLDLGEYIPAELYAIVAEVLIFVDSMERAKGRSGLKLDRS